MVTLQDLGFNNSNICPDISSLKQALADYKLISASNFNTCQNYMSNHLTATDGAIIGLIGIIVGFAFAYVYFWHKRRKEHEKEQNNQDN